MEFLQLRDLRCVHPQNSFDLIEDANLIESAVKEILSGGLRTGDIMEDGCTQVTTEQMGDAILEKLNVMVFTLLLLLGSFHTGKG